MAVANAFDLQADLPIGTTTLIEASAGTGKTFTLAAMTVRFVAEHDVPISQVLLVTFTKASAAELRDRIRAALVAAEAHLRNPEVTTDPVLEQLAQCDVAERQARRVRLDNAIRNFDSAMISTIHGFCSSVLSSQGVLATPNDSSGVIGSEAEIVQQVCSDVLFAQASQSDGEAELPTIKSLLEAVRKVRNLGESEITAESERDTDLLLADLVRRSTAEVEERIRIGGSVTYASMITSVRDLVRSDAQLVEDLRRRFRVALIDEFQDTDPIQWEIFHVLFGSGEPRSTLVLVGDPKQAIYGFRGGDVYTYLAARKLVEPRVLGTNHRSVPQAVDSMNAIGAGQFFGEESIAYQPVDVAAQNRGKQLLIEGSSSSIGPDGCSGDDGGTRVGPGLQVRCLNGFHSFREYDTAPKSIPVEKYHRRIAEDLADVAVDLLNNGILADSAVGPQKLKPVRPADIAVLVGSGAAADPVMKALTRRGVASVKLIKDSVLASEAAEQWLTLLRAMERPADQRLAGAAALTWFFGWSADELAAAVDPRSRAANVELTEVQYQLAIWAEVLERSGVSALFAEARRTSGVVPRLLAQWQGDRNLTDLEHVAELIHTESTSRSVGLSAAQAIDVLDGWMQDVDDEEAIDAMQRRVESDDDSVRILTIHSAKGLEFPVVLLPDLAGGGNRVKTPSDLSYFDRDKGLRVLDVSTEQKASGETKKVSRAKLAPRAIAEAKRQGCGDQHRLTYVALTRATHLSVTWWAPLSGSSLTGLARLLFGVEGDAASDVAIKPPPPEEVFSKLRDRFDSLGAKDSIQVVNVPSELPSPARFDPLRAESLRSAVAHDPMRSRSEPNQAEGVSVTAGRLDDSPLGHLVAETELSVAVLERPLARDAGRWSFSSLKEKVRVISQMADQSASHDRQGELRTDPTIENSDDRGAGDEVSTDRPFPATRPAPVGAASDESDSRWSGPTLFEGLGAGADFGTMVHELYEVVDFTDPDPEEAFRSALHEGSRFVVTPEQQDRLPEALTQTLLTPLGTAFGNIRLADLSERDRLNELDFYIPIAPAGVLPAARIGKIVGEHLQSEHPLRSWAERLKSGLSHVDLTGYMSGAIDLIFRYEVAGQERYSVLDYKTNQLGSPPSQNVGDYHPDRLVAAMEHHEYVLQALIYSVALHRYLRLRLPGYSPATHLGPVAYLFLRGMVGAETPVASSGHWVGSPAGVFTWSVPPTLVEALSDAFDRELEYEVVR